MKKIILYGFLLCFSLSAPAQKFFKPVPGGVVSVKDNNSYYVVQMEGKTNEQIFKALETMVENTFTGVDDKIIEKKPNELIRAYGEVKNMVCGFYDVKFEAEFQIKDGRYIFKYPKLNIGREDQGKRYRILLQKGRNVLNGQEGVTYTFNKKGKVILKKACYKQIISFLDQSGEFFDISNDYEKYVNHKKKEKDDW